MTATTATSSSFYWRRKREQWRLLAGGARTTPPPTTSTATSSPPPRAIDGLEKALTGLGLLDDVLALDLRKPQDYFHRVWSTGRAGAGEGQRRAG
ncbi:hypothetical protein AB0D46_05780 [Streptomyces sp. NPDC048383]|uniref:hypothetical protein n=1 Tax=Streptomyces sp. NPDC048383 TaxID=3155386 RepID=UPI003433D71F